MLIFEWFSLPYCIIISPDNCCYVNNRNLLRRMYELVSFTCIVICLTVLLWGECSALLLFVLSSFVPLFYFQSVDPSRSSILISSICPSTYIFIIHKSIWLIGSHSFSFPLSIFFTFRTMTKKSNDFITRYLCRS